jgi:multiple sugar transport system substrate-binding protein
MPFTDQQKKIILGIFVFIIFFVVLLYFGSKPGNGPKVEIVFWGVGDSRSVFDTAIGNYQSTHPNVQIKYQQIDENNYEKELLDAQAAGQGPDIFMFHNTWLPKHYNKISPAAIEQISVNSFRKLFPQVAEQDFVSNNQIYALPLSIDTLALFYNKNIFDNKHIALPPITWDGFKADILKIREIKSNGSLSKSAASIGGTLKSVPNATDILSMLMLQFKAKMTDDAFSRADFSSPEGLKALNFYMQFTKPAGTYYTWNDSFKNSIDSFANNQTAMIFAYSSEISRIKAKNPLLNFGIQPVPQFTKDESVNYANYWGVAVSKKARYQKEAWDFSIALTTDVGNAISYMVTTGKAPALRSVIDANLADPYFGVFSGQALTARSWPQIDNVEIRKIFNNMIESALISRLTTDKALREAEDQVTNLMQSR